MKTNQLMQVTIGNYTQPIEHKTMMGDLNSLWFYGNGLRAAKGLHPLKIEDWMRSAQTLEFVVALEEKYKQGNCLIMNGEENEPIHLVNAGHGRSELSRPSRFIKTKRGKGGGTWVHLYLMLDAAAWLDASFKVELYDTFINNKILQWRDDSGDEFINLNIAIDAYLPGREGKDNKGVFITIAKLLKAKIKPDEDSWDKASFNQLEHRATIERDLCKFLQMGMIRDFEHLKEVAGKLK